MKLHSQVEGLAFGLGWSTDAPSTVTQDGPGSGTGGLQHLERNRGGSWPIPWEWNPIFPNSAPERIQKASIRMIKLYLLY